MPKIIAREDVKHHELKLLFSDRQIERLARYQHLQEEELEAELKLRAHLRDEIMQKVDAYLSLRSKSIAGAV